MTDTRALLQQALSALLLEATSPPLPTTQAAVDALSAALQAPQVELQPVAWMHDCAGLCTNDVELWINACPHCGKPRTLTAPPAPAVTPSSPELTWLYTHCRAIGMTEQSDSKKWEHDIALFTTRLQDRIRQLESAQPAAREQKDERAAFEAWIKKDCGDLTTFGQGSNMHYRNSAVNNAWTGWKARARGITGGSNE